MGNSIMVWVNTFNTLKKNTVLICLLALTFSLLFSCTKNEDICLEPNNVYANVGFYYQKDSLYQDTIFNNANMYINTSRGLVYYNSKNVTNLALPLSLVSDTTEMYFQPDSSSTIHDTIKWVYSRKNYFVSNTCGYQTHFTIQKILTTHKAIDSVILTKNEINNVANTEHVKIIFK